MYRHQAVKVADAQTVTLRQAGIQRSRHVHGRGLNGHGNFNYAAVRCFHKLKFHKSGLGVFLTGNDAWNHDDIANLLFISTKTLCLVNEMSTMATSV